jgi:pimeloyl-ACP methyl ester carboxylesterase
MVSEMKELDVALADGTTLHAYDTATPGGHEAVAVFWHHGTPNIGSPPKPLFAEAERLGVRWVSFDRPGYGGSARRPGRAIGDAASYVAAVADALGIERFAVMGHSGGGPHALGCAALLPERVVAVVSMAGLAPFDAGGLDWFAGMAASGVASLTAAAGGLDVKEAYEAGNPPYDPEFSEADMAVLGSEWAWLGQVVGPALEQGPGGLVDDDVAYVSPWGFDPASVTSPTLLLHGDRDRVVPCSHSAWLASRIVGSQLQLSPGDGHLSVLRSASQALAWLRERAG